MTEQPPPIPAYLCTGNGPNGETAWIRGDDIAATNDEIIDLGMGAEHGWTWTVERVSEISSVGTEDQA